MHETVSDKINLVIERPRPDDQGCIDMPEFADCSLIIQTPHFNPDSYCNDNKYYSKFCCKSCTEAGRELFSEPEVKDNSITVENEPEYEYN